jgi:hypothetical protein
MRATLLISILDADGIPVGQHPEPLILDPAPPQLTVGHRIAPFVDSLGALVIRGVLWRRAVDGTWEADVACDARPAVKP